MLRKAVFGLVAGVAAIGLTMTGAQAEVDFSGKRVEIIVPFSEGGGTDSYARFLQPYLERYLPGNPTINVVNKPGAGGISGGNYFQQRAKPDGMTILALSTSTLLNSALKDPRVRFDLSTMAPILLSPRGIMQYVRSDFGTQDISDIKGQVEKIRSVPADGLIYGGKTPTSGGLHQRVALSLLGIEVKSVFGMKGNGPMAQCFERGECTVSYDNTMSFFNNRKEMIESGLAVPFFTQGFTTADGEFVRDPRAPDTPHFLEVYKAVYGKDLEGPAREAWEAMYHISVSASKSLNLPAGTPKEIVDTYDKAIKALLADPEVIEKGEKIFGPYENFTGAAAKRGLEGAAKMSDAGYQYIKTYVKQRFNVELP